MLQNKFPRVKLKCMEKLELDGYCEDLKIAFEYDGEQHFKEVKLFHRDGKTFEDGQKRDLRKGELCKKNNILLIRVPYYIKFDKIQEFIRVELNKNSVTITDHYDKNFKEFKGIYTKNESFLKIKQQVESKGGKLVDTCYINNQAKMKIICKIGHEFELTPKLIISGRWCAVCSKKKKHTIEEMRELAKNRGGECLSDQYISKNTKLNWKCKEGHTWSTIPGVILRGHWCHKCNPGGIKSEEN
jgi:hypothetical protein